MTKYDNCISIEKALYFDLFDDIDYKWLKLILDPSVDREEYDFEVEIEDIPVEEVIEGFFKISPECRTTFTFDLKMAKRRPSYNANGYTTEYITKTFTKTIDYDGSSAIAMTLCGMKDNEEEEEEEEEEY
jgi:hypothetical protein